MVYNLYIVVYLALFWEKFFPAFRNHVAMKRSVSAITEASVGLLALPKDVFHKLLSYLRIGEVMMLALTGNTVRTRTVLTL